MVVTRSSSGGVEKLCISGFKDDVIFAHNGPCGLLEACRYRYSKWRHCVVVRRQTPLRRPIGVLDNGGRRDETSPSWKECRPGAESAMRRCLASLVNRWFHSTGPVGCCYCHLYSIGQRLVMDCVTKCMRSRQTRQHSADCHIRAGRLIAVINIH